MGLLTEVVLLPLAPARIALWTIDQVIQAANRAHTSPAAVRRELIQLSQDLDAGLISPEEFNRREDELLDRLEATPHD